MYQFKSGDKVFAPFVSNKPLYVLKHMYSDTLQIYDLDNCESFEEKDYVLRTTIYGNDKVEPFSRYVQLLYPANNETQYLLSTLNIGNMILPVPKWQRGLVRITQYSPKGVFYFCEQYYEFNVLFRYSDDAKTITCIGLKTLNTFQTSVNSLVKVFI